MATLATSTTAPIVQLLRATGPCRVLTVADVVALTAETVAMLDAIEPAPLPSLTSAFSRRRAIFGAVAATIGSVAALPALASIIAPAPGDARLVHLADELEALDRAANAWPSGKSREAAFEALVDGFEPLEEKIADTQADTLVGVLAKIRALDVPTTGEYGNPGCHNIFVSITEDITRLHAAGVIHV